jgi:hypothetical protein
VRTASGERVTESPCVALSTHLQTAAEQLTALETALAGIVEHTRRQAQQQTADAGPPRAALGPGTEGITNSEEAQKWNAVARWAAHDSVSAARAGDRPSDWASSYRRCVAGCSPEGAAAEETFKTRRHDSSCCK